MEVVDLGGGETIATGRLTRRILEDGSHTGHRLRYAAGGAEPR